MLIFLIVAEKQPLWYIAGVLLQLGKPIKIHEIDYNEHQEDFPISRTGSAQRNG